MASNRMPSGPSGSARRSSRSARLDPVEPRKAPAGGGDRALAEVDDPAERLEGPHELEQQRDEQCELADRQRAGDHVAPPEQQHCRDAERGEEEQPGQEPRLDARLVHRLAAHALRAVAEPVAHVVLPPECLHHLDADDSFVRGLRQMPLALLHLA